MASLIFRKKEITELQSDDENGFVLILSQRPRALNTLVP